jgi:hypothetical protein
VYPSDMVVGNSVGCLIPPNPATAARESAPQASASLMPGHGWGKCHTRLRRRLGMHSPNFDSPTQGAGGNFEAPLHLTHVRAGRQIAARASGALVHCWSD